jgi:hypothetical protein
MRMMVHEGVHSHPLESDNDPPHMCFAKREGELVSVFAQIRRGSRPLTAWRCRRPADFVTEDMDCVSFHLTVSKHVARMDGYVAIDIETWSA